MWVTTIGPHWLHVAAEKKKSFRLKRKKKIVYVAMAFLAMKYTLNATAVKEIERRPQF